MTEVRLPILPPETPDDGLRVLECVMLAPDAFRAKLELDRSGTMVPITVHASKLVLSLDGTGGNLVYEPDSLPLAERLRVRQCLYPYLDRFINFAPWTPNATKRPDLLRRFQAATANSWTVVLDEVVEFPGLELGVAFSLTGVTPDGFASQAVRCALTNLSVVNGREAARIQSLGTFELPSTALDALRLASKQVFELVRGELGQKVNYLGLQGVEFGPLDDEQIAELAPLGTPESENPARRLEVIRAQRLSRYTVWLRLEFYYEHIVMPVLEVIISVPHDGMKLSIIDTKTGKAPCCSRPAIALLQLLVAELGVRLDMEDDSNESEETIY